MATIGTMHKSIFHRSRRSNLGSKTDSPLLEFATRLDRIEQEALKNVLIGSNIGLVGDCLHGGTFEAVGASGRGIATHVCCCWVVKAAERQIKDRRGRRDAASYSCGHGEGPLEGGQ